MTKKQEKIKEAYGQYWDLVRGLVRPDGSLAESVWFGTEIDLPHHDLSTGYLKPNALRGISDNNGWISIESEADLPKGSSNYWIMQSDNRVQTMKEYEGNKEYYNITATHYQPIVKPKPPIY